ncbi:MAG TPA: PQQ-binding-like beta-propeller repeat protein [Polyangiaceae bacterium]|nr:PQQ-binding-like beta-propeller repeat protein [Polyangiaceae bacterium]
MRSFEIFVDQGSSAEPAPRGETSLAQRRGGAPRGPAPREVLDIFIQGTNVTASVNERNAVSVLRDLASALTPLLAAHRGKAIVRFYDDSWELAVERFGPTALLSVYRAGGDPKVLVHERPVAFSEVRASVLDALASAAGASAAGVSRARAPELETVRRLLADTEDLGADNDLPLPRPTPVVIELDRDAPISFAAEFLLREGARGAAQSSVERADLHALLFRGRMRAEIRGRAVDLGEAAPFLVAERLVELARGALASWERGQGFHVRANAGGLLLGLRASCDAAGSESAALVLGSAELASRERALYTFPNLGVSDVVEAALAFGRAVVRAVVRRDRSQSMNLRLSAFRRQVRELEGALREVKRSDSFVNRAPESYRAFAEGAARPRSDAVPPARLRYAPKWRAQIAGIDLRGTFLCGDRLIVGSVHELACLDRATGDVLWRAPASRATSVVTPAGIARVASDGEVTVHDFGNGEVALRTWIAPRGAGPQAGCVVSAPGLPRLLILTEGERHLVALDLLTGEPRWRYAWGKSSGALRLKRSGKLLYVATGDTALTALDVATGSVVWRVRDRLRFCAAPTVDQHGLYAVAGAAHGPGQLAIVDPFSGEVRVSHALTGTVTVEGSPLVASDAVVLALRQRDGLRLVGLDRATGKPRFDTKTAVAPVGTSWLAVDDLIIGNTPTGELLAVESTGGRVRYRQELGRANEADAPRRLEPVLRSGALFVPHIDVHVFRPQDGARLGTVGPCDAIPDLLRVDEKCDAYIAEESGHLAAFGSGARLSLVR